MIQYAFLYCKAPTMLPTWLTWAIWNYKPEFQLDHKLNTTFSDILAFLCIPIFASEVQVKQNTIVTCLVSTWEHHCKSSSILLWTVKDTHRANNGVRTGKSVESIKPASTCLHQAFSIFTYRGTTIHVHIDVQRPRSCWDKAVRFLSSATVCFLICTSENSRKRLTIVSTKQPTRWT